MKNAREFVWPLIGFVAVIVSGYLLYRELRDISFVTVWASLAAIPPHRYLLAGLSTLVAYAALAWYDRIALLHLGVHHISWFFVSVCSFTTYALSHNIGASVFSGALVRYRAYTSKGLSAPQVAVLVALCSFTFGLGTILLGGFVLTINPGLLSRLEGAACTIALTNPTTARILGLALLAFVALYVVGSLLHLKPITILKFRLDYPRPAVMVRQLVAAPLELLGAAGIIYFALPAHLEPSFLTVLAVFLASFSAALASHAPGRAWGVRDHLHHGDARHSETRRARRAADLPALLPPHSLRDRDRRGAAVRARAPRACLARPDGAGDEPAAAGHARTARLIVRRRAAPARLRPRDDPRALAARLLHPLPPCRHGRPDGLPGPAPAVSRRRSPGSGRCSTTSARRRAILTRIASGDGPARFDQDWFPRLDAAAAYAILRAHKPRRIVEIGSGHSTRFLARAVADGGLGTTITCIDPAPRADHRIARASRHVPSAPLRGRSAGFLRRARGRATCCSSIRAIIAMPGTDVDRLFLDLLPRLPPGVLVHVHDVFLPDPYPPEWAWRGYNEQLLVGALLQGGAYELVFASRYVAAYRPDWLDPVLRLPLPEGAYETSLWLRKR